MSTLLKRTTNSFYFKAKVENLLLKKEGILKDLNDHITNISTWFIKTDLYKLKTR